MRKGTISHLLRLLTVTLMLVTVAVNRDGRILGHGLSEKERPDSAETVSGTVDGPVIISTKEIGKDIQGYGGPTPLTVTVEGGVVTGIRAEKNSETPDFFNNAFSYLSRKWIGRKASDILAMDVDGASGATMSSRSLDGHMRLALRQLPETETAAADSQNAWTAVRTAVLIVVALGCILPLFPAFRKYRTAWLTVNVIVLGLWGGTFLSHSLLVSLLSNGIGLTSSLAVVLMLVAAFVYPLFGKKSHYCTWICPMGSLQDIAGRIGRGHRLRLPAGALRGLAVFNEVLWAALMLMMLTGVWFEWMDYELFTAFLFTTASPVVVAIAIVFVALSVVVPRPYCRIVCPTGCLFRVAQQGKRHGKS